MVQLLYRHGFWVQAGRGFDQDFQDLSIFRIQECFLTAKTQRRKVRHFCNELYIVYLKLLQFQSLRPGAWLCYGKRQRQSAREQYFPAHQVALGYMH